MARGDITEFNDKYGSLLDGLGGNEDKAMRSLLSGSECDLEAHQRADITYQMFVAAEKANHTEVNNFMGKQSAREKHRAKFHEHADSHIHASVSKNIEDFYSKAKSDADEIARAITAKSLSLKVNGTVYSAENASAALQQIRASLIAQFPEEADAKYADSKFARILRIISPTNIGSAAITEGYDGQVLLSDIPGEVAQFDIDFSADGTISVKYEADSTFSTVAMVSDLDIARRMGDDSPVGRIHSEITIDSKFETFDMETKFVPDGLKHKSSAPKAR